MKNRVPHEYFITKGEGSSPYAVHAGSYHIALNEAGISDYNIMTYSSVIPATAKEIPQTNKMPFGSELMTIMAVKNGGQGEFISAGIVFGDLMKGKVKIGSLVCELSGSYEIQDLKEKLDNVITDLHTRTYGDYDLTNLKYVTNEYTVEDTFGTVLVALCFTSFN